MKSFKVSSMGELVLILDFDGVITKLDIDWVKVREEVSKAVGFQVNSLVDFWDKYFGTELFHVASGVVEKYEVEEALRAKPYEDVEKALNAFKGKVYIASLQSKKALYLFLEKNGLRGYFREILGREDFGSKFRQVQYVMNKETIAERIFLVDDSRRNISACKPLGIECILFNRKSGYDLLNLVKKIEQL